MKQYLDLMKYVLENGHEKSDRTGTGTLSVFGHQSRYDLSEGLPLVTTKKCHMRSIIHELLWFIKGETNIQYLKDNKVSIWDEIRNGLACRPIHFHPMFQKHAHTGCGGVFIEVKDPRCAKTWEFGQHLMKNFYKHLKEEFIWNEKPYEYEHDRLAIDLINGSSKIRNWIENNGTKKELRTIVDKSGLSEFIEKRSACLLYS